MVLSTFEIMTRATAKGSARVKWKTFFISCKVGDTLIVNGHQRTNAYYNARLVGVMITTKGLPNNQSLLTVTKT